MFAMRLVAPLLLLLVLAPQVSAEDRYFVAIFGSESVPKRARYTHTWATMVKVTSLPETPDRYELQAHTISWLPRTLVVRPLALRAECGVNLSLQATFRECFCNRECVAMWGPYEFDPERGPLVYQRVLNQIARLESGCVLYKAVDPDTGPRSKYISNCIHAVSDLDPYLPRPSYNELRDHGMSASRNLVQVLASRHRFDPTVTHEWIAQAIGVDDRVQRRTVPRPAH